MGINEPFVIPPGIRFEVTKAGAVVEYAGDIRIHDSFGRHLLRVMSTEGSIQLRGDLSADNIEAPKGTVEILGPLRADRVLGKVVEISAGPFRARAVRAGQKISVGPAQLVVDVLMAPNIEIDARASGRVPIVESKNTVGPNAIKGCFSLEEYDEILGDVDHFLEERGIARLEPGREPGSSPGEPPEAPITATEGPPDPELESFSPMEPQPRDHLPGSKLDESTDDPVTQPEMNKPASSSGGFAFTASPGRVVTLHPDIDSMDVLDEDSLPEVDP